MSETNFEQMKVGELREWLVKSGMFTEESAKSVIGKSNVVYEIMKLQAQNLLPANLGNPSVATLAVTGSEPEPEVKAGVNTSAEELFNKLEPVVQEVAKESFVNVERVVYKGETTEEKQPDINSPEWHDYVMSKLLPEEKDGENPKVCGLRRVAQALLGDFKYSGPSQVFPATQSNENGRATVVFTIEIWWKLGMGPYFNLNTDFPLRTFSGVAEAWEENVKGEIFQKFPVTIAETRAEGRALRRALNLRNVVAAEELPDKAAESPTQTTTGEFNASEPMGPAQVSFLKTLCERAKISYDKLELTDKTTKQEVKDLANKINQWIKTPDSIPENLKG